MGNLQFRGTHPQPNSSLSRSPQSWGTHPQLNWRLPTTPQPYRVKDPRVTSPQTFTSTKPCGESLPMQQMQMARAQVLKSFTLKFQQSNKCLWGNKRGRTNLCNQCKCQEHKCSNPSLSNSNKETNAYGGIREEEQRRRNTKNSKIKIY